MWLGVSQQFMWLGEIVFAKMSLYNFFDLLNTLTSSENIILPTLTVTTKKNAPKAVTWVTG